MIEAQDANGALVDIAIVDTLIEIVASLVTIRVAFQTLGQHPGDIEQKLSSVGHLLEDQETKITDKLKRIMDPWVEESKNG